MRRFITFRHLTISNDLLPAIVNDDPTGLEDGDIEQLNRFLAELDAEIASFCKSLTTDKYFYDIIFADVIEDDFRRCDVTGLQALCSPVTVMVTTYGGTAPGADLYEYKSFAN